ncbi:cobalt-precorrin-6A reductase [Belnapia sp. F-4-1]|uniref:cobalt-precorrin-6A reductase n=1 Tax=Belnapia sp. F-4-1 TaxID=1545443 RepID=UPI0005BB5F29|nr:cobalt-precorrin-6A reductase [Belnapia sp. F-4-1]
MTRRILILGGTTEARELAGALAGFDVTLSLAGRTAVPVRQPVPVRVGGFGGVAGLVEHLRSEGVGLLVDATHPYAATISAHAAEAAAIAGVALLALRRPAWRRVERDDWMEVPDGTAAVAALGKASRRVFLALGRQEVAGFVAAPQHDYLIRSVDPIEPKLGVPRAAYLLGRGPFDVAEERAMLETHRIERIVCKNSGGAATYGKIAAARELGIRVVMLARPVLPEVPSVGSVAEACAWIGHWAARRGV